MVTVGKSTPPGSVSTADVRVSDTEPPPWPTTNVPNALWSAPFTGGCTTPVRTSVVRVGDGLAGVAVSELLHADARTATLTTRAVSVALVDCMRVCARQQATCRRFRRALRRDPIGVARATCLLMAHNEILAVESSKPHSPWDKERIARESVTTTRHCRPRRALGQRAGPGSQMDDVRADGICERVILLRLDVTTRARSVDRHASTTSSNACVIGTRTSAPKTGRPRFRSRAAAGGSSMRRPPWRRFSSPESAVTKLISLSTCFSSVRY